MNLLSSKTAWQPTLVIAAILLVGFIGYSTRTIMKAMRETDQPQAILPAPAPPETTMPAAALAPEPPPNTAVPSSSTTTADISAEFDKIRKQEQGRKELIENLRKQSRENPGDPGTLSKERIDALEKSGDSLM